MSGVSAALGVDEKTPTRTERVRQIKKAVIMYVNSRITAPGSVESPAPITEEDLELVWFSKTLQHWKALVVPLTAPGMYYELTYNGDKKELYLDEYMKVNNALLRHETAQQ